MLVRHIDAARGVFDFAATHIVVAGGALVVGGVVDAYDVFADGRERPDGGSPVVGLQEDVVPGVGIGVPTVVARARDDGDALAA